MRTGLGAQVAQRSAQLQPEMVLPHSPKTSRPNIFFDKGGQGCHIISKIKNIGVGLTRKSLKEELGEKTSKGSPLRRPVVIR